MGNPNEPYHNEGFGSAFLTIILFGLVLPGIIILSIDNGFTKFVLWGTLGVIAVLVILAITLL